MRKIITEYIYPPIPIRYKDWCAYYENSGAEEHGTQGWGRTEAEAIQNLKDAEEE